MNPHLVVAAAVASAVNLGDRVEPDQVAELTAAVTLDGLMILRGDGLVVAADPDRLDRLPLLLYW
jgi:hypothetical protein